MQKVKIKGRSDQKLIGQTGGRTEAIALHPLLMQSVKNGFGMCCMNILGSGTR